MKRHPTTVPMRCLLCGATVRMPVTQSLIVGDVMQVQVDGTAMEAHMVVCEAERILEAAE